MDPKVIADNNLVDHNRDNVALRINKLGITVGFPNVTEEPVSFRPDEPITLEGAYRVNGPVLEQLPGPPVEQILLVLVRSDDPTGYMKRISLSQWAIEKPAPPEPLPFDHTEGGVFSVDLRAFFELSDTVRGGFISAYLGPYRSRVARFAVDVP